MVTLCKGARSGGGRVTRLAKPSCAGDRHAIAVKPLLADNVRFDDSFIRGRAMALDPLVLVLAILRETSAAAAPRTCVCVPLTLGCTDEE